MTNEDLLEQGHAFVTSNFVLDETITLIRYRIGHRAAVDFWHLLKELISDGLLSLIRIDEGHEAAAWQIFEKHTDQDFSYTDCTSFAVMRELEKKSQASN